MVDLTAEFITYYQDLETRLGRQAELSQELESLRQAHAGWQEQLAQTTAELNAARGQLTAALDAVTGKDLELKQEKAQVTQLTADVADLNTRLKSARKCVPAPEEIQRLQGRIDALKKRVRSLCGWGKRLKQDKKGFDGTNDRIRELEGQLETAKAETNRWKREYYILKVKHPV
jgi:chromosome segregation ATPase